MLYCCVSIDFLSQLERTGSKDAPTLIEEIKALATAFGGVMSPKKSPLVLAFPSGGLFDGIQASEALQRIAEAVERKERGLRGAAVIAHDAGSMEDAQAYLVAARYSCESEYLYAMSPEARALLADYGATAPDGWPTPAYRGALGDADAALLFERPRLSETLAKAIGRSARQGPRLVHLDAGRGARDLSSIITAQNEASAEARAEASAEARAEARILCLEGSRARALPFSPLAEAVHGSTPAEGAEPLSLAVASAFSHSLSSSVLKGCAAYLHRWLDAFGADGGVVICDDPDAFSPEARELIAQRLASGQGSEHYLSIASGGLTEAWAGPWAAKVSAGQADGDDADAAQERALGSTEGRARLGLRSRFSLVGGLSTPALDAAGALLSLLPLEAATYLYAVLAAWRELSEAELSDFMRGLGLLPEGERLLAGLLSRAGLLAPSGRPLQPMDVAAVREIVGNATATAIDERLAAFLVGLYRVGRIRPSLGLLGRVGERAEEERLLYDCVFDAVSRPDLSEEDDTGMLSPSSLAIYRFWSALGRRDEEAALSSAEEAERSITGPRGQALRALVSAELGYAQGDPSRSAKGAREAMLAMGRNAPPRLEARSHRMMGLASLALDRHAEASDYLTNAQELAESVGSEHERMMAAYARAIAEYLSGAIGRSAKAAKAAEDSARRLHRIDMLVAIEALRGRVDFDLGCYEEAARRFSCLAGLSVDYGIAAAPERAAIWQARALGYARRYDEAEPALEAHRYDMEARAFRAELDILRGRPREARAWLEAPGHPERRSPERRSFMPPDTVDWSSLYAEFEGRSLGFSDSSSPLATFVTALSLFARGLDERDAACAVELHALSRSERGSRHDPGMGTYCFFCYLLEERLPEPPVDRQTVLSRAFKLLQERSGRIEERSHRALYMEKNVWNRRLMEAAREHKFI